MLSRSSFSYLSLILHLASAYFSAGYYHADEHFQVIEFTSFLLGKSPENELPLEYHEKMRPWLLPAVFYLISLPLQALGISNPFHLAFGYRLVTSFLGWQCTLALYDWSKKNLISEAFLIARVALLTLWFLPAFHARTSSENTAGSLFFFGLTCSSPLMSGLFWGLAFHCRYQILLMIGGGGLWIFFHERKRCLKLITGFLATFVIGILIDLWGYRTLCFPAWNYLRFNLIENHVSDSETSPFWDYFRRAVTESFPVLGVGVLILTLFFIYRKPKNVLTWSMAPFLGFHFLIGHKELRFLFPILHAAPIYLSEALIRFPKKLLNALFIWNLVALILYTLSPAWTPIRFHQALWEFRPKTLWYQDDRLLQSGGAHLHFYRPSFIHFQPFSSEAHPKEPYWAFFPNLYSLQSGCVPKYSMLPLNLPFLERFPNVSNWTLSYCVPRMKDL